MRLVLDLPDGDAARRQWHQHLSRGGAFVPGASAPPMTPCQLELRGVGAPPLTLAATVVMSVPGGVGLALDGFGPALRDRLAAWVAAVAAAAPPQPAAPVAPAPTAAPAAPAAHGDPAHDDAAGATAPTEPDDDDRDAPPEIRNVFARLRNLSVPEQLRVARDGEIHERTALERLYGKTVWDALLRNPRLSHPEVARIARMGALPRPLLELIVGNTAWLRSPEVRRALLANLRLTPDMIQRVLRLLPRHELRLVPVQTAYPSPVRDAARRMLQDD